MDRNTLKASGATNAIATGAQRARHARVGRAHAERQRLVERRVDAHGLGGDRVVADRHDRAPRAAAQQVGRRAHRARRARRGSGSRATGRRSAASRTARSGLRARSPASRRSSARSTSGSAAPRARARTSRAPGRGLRAARAGMPKRKPDHETQDAGRGRSSTPYGTFQLVDHDRGRVRAERVERAVAQRDLAVVAGQDVQTRAAPSRR